MAITKDTVKYAADLARIELSENEIAHFTGQLERVLGHVKKLEAINVSKLEPTSHVLELKNVFREDVVKESLPRSDVIKNAPASQDNMFKVMKIIER